MDAVVLDRIARFVQQQSGLCFVEHKRSILKQRLTERLLHLNITDVKEYFHYLMKDPQEEAMLLDLISINETSFFRNPRQFLYLTEQIVPELEADRSKKMNLSQGGEVFGSPKMGMRILCAGCSTGEEPYSVAMALFAALRYPRAWDIDILAGDLSESCILTATAGYYEADRLRSMPAAYLDRYMKKFDRGAVVNDEIKNLIRFCRLNLNDNINGKPLPGYVKGPGLFDMIFCRNVLIYFSPETQQRLIDLLFHLLAPGGYLFTGDAEPLHLYDHEFETVREAGCLIYRKTGTLENAEAV